MKIALLGDIALFGKFSSKNNVNLKGYFASVSKLLEQVDYVVGNLETPFVDGQKTYGAKSAHICTYLQDIEVLKLLHIDAVNLANNHMFDYGLSAYELTKKHLEAHNIKYFGVEGKKCYVEKYDSKIALSGYCCYSTNPLGMGVNGINELNVPVVYSQMKQNNENGYLNIVSVHAGQEHVNYPDYDSIMLARQLGKKMDYVYYGHHPHVIQGIEKKCNSLLLYSLGNFCFDDVYTKKSASPLIRLSENNKMGIIVILDVQVNKLVDYQIVPIYMGGAEMIVGNDMVLGDIELYSKALDLPMEEYMNRRRILIDRYIQDRKKNRNLDWYFKRLNLNSLKMIINSRNNYRKYLLNVKKYL